MRGLEISSAVEAVDSGTGDLAYEPDEELPYWKNPHQPTRMVVAKVGGDVVAEASYETQVGEGADTGWLAVHVPPEFRGHGIGTALVRGGRADGARGRQGQGASPTRALQDVAGERIPSPTGFGSIPAEHRDVRFLLARGYRFEQVERLSRLPLPVPGLDERRRSAPQRRAAPTTPCTPGSGPPPRTGATTSRSRDPDEHRRTQRRARGAGGRLDGRAASSRRDEAGTRRARATGSSRSVEHVPSGHLAGFTVLFGARAAASRGRAVRDPRAAGAPRSQARHAAQGREPASTSSG